MGKDAKGQELLKNLADLSPEKRALLALRALRLKKSDENARQNLTIPRIERQPGFNTLPLSFAQQRLWFLYQMNPDSDAYNLPSGVHLVGQLDIAALEKALNEIVRRHEVLRTAFGIKDGLPVQIIHPDVSISLPVINLSHIPQDERQAEVQKLFTAEAAKPFDLSRGPLLRTTLLRLGEQEHIVLLTMHHIVRDGWSRGILVREVSQLYGAFAKGQPSPLAELPIQYADYAVWQREWLQGEVLQQHLSFWKEQLGGTLPTLELPTDRPRQPVQSFRGALYQFSLSPSLSEALKQLSQREGVTLYMTLCAAYMTLLHRYTRQPDMIVGTPIAGRDRGETEALIGFFVNTLALRTDMSGNPTFRELLARVRKVTLGAFANQNLPFQKLVEELQPERNLSRNPIIQVMFTLQNTPLENLEMEGLQATPVQPAQRVETYDELHLMMIEAEDRLHCTLEYQTDLFDEPTIERMSLHFNSLLEGIIAEPETRIAELPLLTDSERHQIAVEWNQTAADYTENVIHEIFEAQAERTPDAPALVFGNASLTYAELNARANQLARYLRDRGAGADVPVGLCVERSVELVVGVLGILKAGGAYIPLDPTYPKDRLTLMLKTSASPLIVTTHNLRDIVSEAGAQIVCLDADWPEISLAPGDNLASCVSPSNLGYIIFTSGSTGTPKGVALHQRALVNLINWEGQNLALDQSPRTLQFASINFDVSFEEMFTTWSKGGTLFLLTEAERRDPEVLFDLINEWAINRMFSPVVILQQLALTFSQRGEASAPHSLRQVITAGSQLQITDEIKRFFLAMPQCELNNHYGPSETHTMMHHRVGLASDEWETLPPIGRPFANTEIYVLDERREVLPVGVPGELHIGGAQVGRGYWNRPDLTAEKFIPDPFSGRAGARLYRTGDLVRSRRDGSIEWLGRIDQQVKIRGFRVELGEIESLLRGHAGVEEVAVIVRTDTPGEQRLVAYIVPASAAAPPHIGELREMLKAKLPEYMVPASFVLLDALPLTPSKKIDRLALPRPAQTRPELNAAMVAPRTPLEKLLADIWSDVLKLEQVGVQDNFLELGGDSILSIQVVSRANRAGLPLTLAQLWEHQTIAAQAAAVAQLVPVNTTPHKVAAPRETQPRRGVKRTPADFPLAQLDQPTLDMLLGAHPTLQDVYPLSPMQQGILFHSLLKPATGEYVEQFSSILRGRLNVAAFELAWQQVVERHPALRTSFVWDGLDEPLQIVHETAALSLQQFDWREMPPVEQRERFRDFIEEETQAGKFDLSATPLMRIFLFRLAEEVHHFVWSFHDIVIDGWSAPLILEEVSAGYEAINRSGQAERFTAHPYRDFIEWQQSQDHSDAETFWRQVLAGFSEPTRLARASTVKDSTVHPETYRQQRVLLPKALMSALQTLARQQQLTLNTLMQGAWALLLNRFTGNEDVLFGSVVSGRPPELPGVESTVGVFINTLPVRARVPREGSLGAWLRELQAQQVEARRYEFTPLVQIQRWSRIPHGQRLFESILAFVNYPAESEGFWNEKDWHLQKSGYPLFFVIRPGAELLLEITYGSLYFTDQAVGQMLSYFRMYLEMMVENATQSLARFDLLTADDRDLLLNVWNETTENFPLDTCFHNLFEAQAERTPDRVAVLSEGRRLTYSELNRRANRLARALVRRGVGTDVVVALLAERGIDFLTAMLAIFKAGGAYLPVDPLSPPGRLAQVLERSAASLALAASEFMPKLEAALEESESPGGTFEVLGLEELLDESESEENLGALAAPGNLAYVIFTSGSTGVPKGAMIEHRGMLNHLFAKISELRLTAEDSIAQTASQSFDISVWQFLAALLVGGRVHVLRDEVAHDPVRLLESAELHSITILEVVPSLMRVMLDEIGHHASARPSLAALRWFIPTGEALPPELCMRWFEFYPHVPLLNAYGPTECSDDVTHYPMKTSPDNALNIPIGMPVSNMRLYVLDEQWRPVPVGVEGELCVGGVGVGRGYLRDVVSTAKAFIPDNFSVAPGVRLYRTGDKARRRHDGQIEFLGRLDYQVKVRGFRIELGEIETVLAQHQSVGQVIVVASEDTTGGQRLVAYVVPAPGQQAEDGQLRAYLQARLPDYMIPAHFVKLDALPLTPNGKIDRKALPQPEHLAATEADYAAPRTPVEERLARIWTEVLGIERVGIDDDFFALGGHSLLATLVISRIRQSLGVEVALHKIFELPTVGTLAGEIETAMREHAAPKAPPLVPCARDEKVPLSYAQQRLWFLDRLEPGSSSYNIHTTVRLKGHLDVAALELTLAEIIKRHEVLRTTFPDVDGQPVQVIAPAGAFQLPLLDLSDLLEATREAEVRRISRGEALRPFNLSDGPLLHARLLRLSATEHVALFTMHHIISDGWSMGVLTNEIAALYDSYSKGLPSPLTELPVQYADYAVWQRQWLQGETLEQELGYWTLQLAGAPPVLPLPTDRPRTAKQNRQGKVQSLRLSKELTAQLKELCRREGVTLFMTLLAGFNALLSRYTGETDIVVGTPIAGRNRSETEGLIGFFVNTLALRTDLSGEPSFRELLGRVREVCLGGYAHQEVPFERLVEELQVERSLDHSPLFQVLFSLQNAPVENFELPGIEISGVAIENPMAKFDLLLDTAEVGEEVACRMQYSADLFDDSTISGLLKHFERLLEAAVSDAGQGVSRLPLLSDEERAAELWGWNQTHREYAESSCFHQLFEQQVARTPDAVAARYNEETLTYAKLSSRADALARHLQSMGVAPDNLVGILAQRSIEMLVALLGVLKAGAAYVPLDPTNPPERLTYILQDADVKLLLTQEHLAGSLQDVHVPVVLLDAEQAIVESSGHGDTPLVAGAVADNLAYVIYTSGSTGKPKGTLITHRGLVNYLSWCVEAYALKAGSRAPVHSSISFDLTVTGLLAPLLVGGQVELLPEDVGIESLASAVKRGGEYGLIKLTPTQLELLAQRITPEEAAQCTHAFIVGGEQLSFEALRFWRQHAPLARVINEYGPTETVVGCCVYEVAADDLGSAAVPVGHPIANTRIYLLDANFEAVPRGVSGELYIASPGVARGYLNRPDLTAENFLPDPFSTEPGARMYRSGDLARRLPKGEIEFLRRRDSQVKLRGFRVELGEIEATLRRLHAVQDCAVVLRRTSGGEQSQLVAYFVAADEEVAGGKLRESLKETLPDYMIPAHFVKLDALPLTPNGKVDRKALPEPDQIAVDAESFVLPRTPVEETLARIWAEVLEVERVSATDNFFELGGHSLLATQIASRMQVAFGVEIPVRRLFELPTLDTLAQFIESAIFDDIEEMPEATVEALVNRKP
jgi:amino acid adenylation domain-containing protein